MVIKIMPDFECFPIWIEKEGGYFENIDPAELHISEDLKNKITVFQKEYDKTLNQEYPPDSGFSSEREGVDFENLGLSIWKQMLKEIENTHEIKYFSILRKKLYANIQQYNKAIVNKNVG